MFRVLAALFLSLLAACTPTVSTQSVWIDSYYHSTVNGEPALYDGGTWIYEAPAYTLRYTLGSLPEGIAPASIKFELNTKQPLTLAWDESVFIYSRGRTSPLIHEGVPYGAKHVPNTELPAGYNLVDRIIPRRNLLVRGDRVTGVIPLADAADLGASSFTVELVLRAPQQERLQIRLEPPR